MAFLVYNSKGELKEIKVFSHPRTYCAKDALLQRGHCCTQVWKMTFTSTSFANVFMCNAWNFLECFTEVRLCHPKLPLTFTVPSGIRTAWNLRAFLCPCFFFNILFPMYPVFLHKVFMWSQLSYNPDCAGWYNNLTELESSERRECQLKKECLHKIHL